MGEPHAPGCRLFGGKLGGGVRQSLDVARGWYFFACSGPIGDDGADDAGDSAGGLRTRPGDAGGVNEPASEGGARGRRRIGRGPELSEGVGGSPLLQAIEQKMDPLLGKNGRPRSDARHV